MAKSMLLKSLLDSVKERRPSVVYLDMEMSNEMSNEITQLGRTNLQEIQKAMEKFDFENTDKTTHENIGGVVFPVTYCKNGMILIDYPNKL